MKRRKSAVCQACSGLLAVGMLVVASNGHAQFSSPPPAPTPATPVPLSGRTGQSGGVATTASPVPSTTASVNTLNLTVSAQGPYAGSASSTQQLPFSGSLSLQEAIDRGIRFNLGAVGAQQALLQSQQQVKAARSALLPQISAQANDTEQTFNLASIGVGSSSPGFALPSLVGPFNIFDVRGYISQTIADFTSINNYRSAKQLASAGQLATKDAQDLIVLAVGGQYLQVIAANARLASARAQLETSNALYQQTMQQLQFGRAARIDVNRSHVAVLTDQQRLSTLQNDLAKQKMALARMIGLPANPDYQLTTEMPYAPAPPLTVEAAIKQAMENRADLKAAEAQVAAAERAVAAARDERLPTASANANYGAIGNPGHLLATYSISATVSVTLWNGGRISSDIQQAEAALTQRRAELEDTRSQIESDVRNAYLDLEAAADQVTVAQQNIDLMGETLAETRQRFEAGVSQNYDIVVSQESVAGARLDYINSVFAHNLAKLSLVRALGNAPQTLGEFLKLQ